MWTRIEKVLQRLVSLGYIYSEVESNLEYMDKTNAGALGLVTSKSKW
jgi:hypothetical protein